jgi:hypothetical protein
MPALTLNSVDTDNVGAASEATPINIGEQSRAYAGNLRNSIRGQKRAWTVQISHIETADKETILAAIADEAPIVASGDILGGSFTVSVKDNGSQMVPGIVPILWDLNLTFEEV